ncbi:MAG TPA: hypothetical protein VEB64_01555 [Azospirillaceae bacterium]|nr:hypothetical protein [Azospirillaceae bacterium]
MFTRDELHALIAQDTAPAISIFMPTHVAGREIRQDPIRLKNLADNALGALIRQGLRSPDAEELLKPVFQLTDDNVFWRHQDRGLALFLAPGFFRLYHTPQEFDEQVVVGQRFHIKPLLPLLAADGAFYLLTVSVARATLYQGSRFALAEVEVDGMPQGVDEIYRETDFQRTYHSSPVARPHYAKNQGGIPKTHGFGEGPEEQRHAQLIEYLRRVAQAVGNRLGGSQAPVVLVARDEIKGQFRSLSTLKTLLDQGVDINPDAVEVDLGRLHQEAYALVRPMFEEERLKALDHFNSLFGDGSPRSPVKVEEVLRASHEGRVDTLLLAQGAAVWGRYDEAAGRVLVGAGPDGVKEDLLDRAAVETIEHGGTVHFITKDKLPPGAQAGAVLRF